MKNHVVTRRRRRVVTAALLSVVVALALVGAAASESVGTSATPAPKRGGTLRWIQIFDAAGGNLDPATGGGNVSTYGLGQAGNAGQNLYPIYGALLKTNGDGISYRPGFATSLTTPDGTTWKLVLRPNIKFSDGTAYNAAAVNAYFTRVMNPAAGTQSPLAARAAEIASTKVVSKTILTLTLKAKDYSFGMTVARFFSTIPSPTAVAADPIGFRTHPVGAGPFMVSSYTPGTSLKLVRNPKYIDAPRPYLDGIDISWIIDYVQARDAFDNAADMLYSSDVAAVSKFLNSTKYGSTRFLDSGGRTMLYNMSPGSPFTDKRAREAVSRALDTKALQAVVGAPPSFNTPTVFPPSSPFFNKNITQITYDKAKAQSLLDAVASANGGKDLTFSLVVPQSIGNQGEAIQAQLSQYNHIKVNLAVVPNGVAVARFGAGQFDAGVSGPFFFSPYDLPANMGTGAPANQGRYSSPAVDLTLKNLAKVKPTNTKAQKVLVDFLQKSIVTDIPFFYYTRYSLFEIWKPNVHVPAKSGFADGLPDLESIWMN